MDSHERLLVFSLDGGKYAVDFRTVETVLRAVAVTRLPNAPEIVMGVFSLRGRIIPVLDIRQRFGLAVRAIDPGDCLIVAKTSRFSVALSAEAMLGVSEDPGPSIAPESILPGLRHVRGVKRVGADLILIQDLDGFLSLDEEGILEGALEQHRKT